MPAWKPCRLLLHAMGEEQVELQIEKKLSQQRAQIVKRDDILADGRQLHSEFSVHLVHWKRNCSCPDTRDGRNHGLVVIRDAVYRALSPGRFRRRRRSRRTSQGGCRWSAPATCLNTSPSRNGDARRILKTGTANPGPWRTDFVPYMREIMDCSVGRLPDRRMRSDEIRAGQPVRRVALTGSATSWTTATVKDAHGHRLA